MPNSRFLKMDALSLGVLLTESMLSWWHRAYLEVNPVEVVAGDIMITSPLTVTPDIPLIRVIERLLEKNVKSVPVVEEDRVIGIVGYREIMALLDRREILFHHEMDLGEIRILLRDRTVRDVMREDIVAVSPDTLLMDVALVMHRNNQHIVPVVDENKHLVGIITRSDLLDHMVGTDEE